MRKLSAGVVLLGFLATGLALIWPVFAKRSSLDEFGSEQQKPASVNHATALYSAGFDKLRSLVVESDVVVVGTVITRVSQGITGRPAIPVEGMSVRVERRLKGDTAETLEVQQTTGLSPDGRRFILESTAQLQPGRRYMLFLKRPMSRMPRKAQDALDQVWVYVPTHPSGVVQLENGVAREPSDPWHRAKTERITSGIIGKSEEALGAEVLRLDSAFKARLEAVDRLAKERVMARLGGANRPKQPRADTK